jgi:hypothetical protein
MLPASSMVTAILPQRHGLGKIAALENQMKLHYNPHIA